MSTFPGSVGNLQSILEGLTSPATGDARQVLHGFHFWLMASMHRDHMEDFRACQKRVAVGATVLMLSLV